MNRMIFPLSLGVAWLALAVGAMPALAQEQGQGSEFSDNTEAANARYDIVVTAQRREQRLQDVPISISAFSQATMDKQGVRRIDDVARLTPGLNFSRGDARSSGLSSISIRGIASNSGAETTGIYVDDTPIQIRRLGFGSGNVYPRIFDLERVEVLRGPQGTLFGAGSEGGTVRFITPAPNFDHVSIYGRSEFSYTEHGEPGYEGGIAAGIPLGEKVAVRASAWYRRDGGWIDRVNFRDGTVLDKNSNWSDAFVVRAALAFRPIETLTITPSIYYQREYTNSPSFLWESLSDPGAGTYRSGNSIRAFNRDRFVLPSLKIEAELGDVATLTSVTSYFSRHQYNLADYTTVDRSALFPFLPPTPPVGAKGIGTFTNTQKNFQQELRLASSNSGDRFRWVLGAFYQRSKQNATQTVEDVTLPSEALAIYGLTFTQLFGQENVDGRFIYVQDPYRGLDEQIAGFAQADLDLTERLTLTAGVRVAHTKFEGDASYGGPFGGLQPSSSGSKSENPVTPKFVATYKFNRDNNIYASASKGYRVGGYNPQPQSICQPQIDALGVRDSIPQTYRSDTLWNYELGSKNAFFDRALRIDASAFYIKWKDIQQFVTLSSCGSGFVSNLGAATSKGFDLQVVANPVPELTLTAAIGYQHTSYDDTITIGTANTTLVTKGDRVAGSPWSVALAAQYDHEIADDRTIYARGDYQFKSRQAGITTSQRPTNLGYTPLQMQAPETHFVTARLGLRTERVDVSLFVDNLLNSTKNLTRANELGNYPFFLTSTFRPRTFGLTGTFRR